MIAAVFTLALLLAGLVGAQHSRTQAKLDEIILLRERLRQEIDESFLQRVPGAEPGSIESTIPGVSRPLQTAIERFDLENPSRNARQELELRVAKGTVANLERRFAETLALLTDRDEALRLLEVDLLRVRGDALYGIGRKEEALDRYRTLTLTAPDRLAAIARLASCQASLGKDSTESYRHLSQRFRKRGDQLVREGKSGAAVEKYRRSVEIETWLSQKTGQHGSALAAALDARGTALLLSGKLAAAAVDFEQAADIYEKPSEPEKSRGLAEVLEHRGDTSLALGNAEAAIEQYDRALALGPGKSAFILNNRANALLALQKLDIASQSYTETINLQNAQGSHATELAISLNNRGVTHFARGNADLALADFESAIKLFSSDKDKGITADDSAAVPPNVHLEVAVGYWNRSLEFVPRPRLAGRSSTFNAVFAMALKNRASARLAKGDSPAALEDLRKAAEVYRRLFEDEEERDLRLPFAKTLNVTAWVYATALDDNFRDPGRGKALALKACELSDWKAFAMVETLAAACAGMGEFNEAVTWQEKALALTPEKQRRDGQVRLQLYRSGKPYRVPVR